MVFTCDRRHEGYIKKYFPTTDVGILEILRNIEKWQTVVAYNQDFTNKYSQISQEEWENIQYDKEAGMYYVLWNHKKMYYPSAYDKSSVAAAFNFTRLEQDISSPHRYLNKDFDVQEGDIVIEAGVAEGNFSLDVVEKAKKIYLIECEHTWVETLRKTFEPWKEKVVIIEKMAGEKMMSRQLQLILW